MGSAQSKQVAAGKADVFQAVVSPLVHPVSARLAVGIDTVGDFVDGVIHASALAEQNRNLQARGRAAEMYEEKLDQLQLEVDRLRKMIGLQPVAGRKAVSAQIAALVPADSRITITVGSTKGVKAGMPVVTGDGLVGVVQSVLAGTSQVTLLSSPFLRIGAVTSRNPPSAGLLHGESTNMLILEFLDFDTTVQNGDMVVTSGFSELIPRGIPIGRVVAYENSREFGTRRSRVFPFVHIGAVREVLVLE